MPSTSSKSPEGPFRRHRLNRGDRREAQILEAAERLLLDRSLQDLTIDHIADAVGLKRASVYFYFSSKQAVVEALLRQRGQDLMRVTESWRAPGDGRDRVSVIRKSIGRARDEWRKHAVILRIGAETWQTNPAIQKIWEAIAENLIAATAAFIEEERRNGVASMTALDARETAIGLVWTAERLFYIDSVAERGPVAPTDVVETITQLWARAIYR